MADMAWVLEILNRHCDSMSGEFANAVIPGRCEASSPESRDSGSGPSDHPGMTERGSVTQLGKVQLFSSLVAAITSRSSFGPGTAGLDAKMSHWFLILSAGRAVTAYISCIS